MSFEICWKCTPSYFDTESSKHIIFQAEPPAGFVTLLTEESTGTLGQPFCLVFRPFSPRLITGTDVDSGRVVVETLISDLPYILEVVSVDGGPLIVFCGIFEDNSISLH